MGVNVHLEREDGTRLASILDPKGVVAKLLPIEEHQFPLLRYVDFYGNTIFNRAQAMQVMKELELLKKRVPRDSEQASYVDRLKELARRCDEEPHLYLKFVGD